MSRYVTVRLTVPQAAALNQAAAEAEAGGEERTAAEWAVLDRARRVLIAALDKATDGKWGEES